MITISIVALMAGMILFAGYSAQESAREQKTRALITKLDAIIKAKWESYKTRRVPILLDENWNDTSGNGTPDPGEYTDLNNSGTYDPIYYTPRQKAKMRLDALRDLMRMEMPDRWTDVTDNPKAPIEYPSPTVKIARPAASQAYLRRYAAGSPTAENQGAECLYLIVMAAIAEEGDSRDVFRQGDVGDTDGDGFPEFIDAWGKPIKFIRWPAGFTSELQTVAHGVAAEVNGVGSQVVTIKVNIAITDPMLGFNQPNTLSTVSGSYVGGAIVKQDTTFGSGEQVPGTSTAQWHGGGVARITGYTYDPMTGQATIICSAPAPIKPFFDSASNSASNNAPQQGEMIYIMGPDPFDPTGVYPIYSNPNTFIPSFATYPLIYSAGSDKFYGIVADTDGGGNPPLSYANKDLYPFVVDSNFQLMGSFPIRALPNEPEVISSTGIFLPEPVWLDNIHNHMIGTR